MKLHVYLIDAYCQDNEIDWEIGDKLINEGNNPDWSHWGFIAEDLAEIDRAFVNKTLRLESMTVFSTKNLPLYC